MTNCVLSHSKIVDLDQPSFQTEHLTTCCFEKVPKKIQKNSYGNNSKTSETESIFFYKGMKILRVWGRWLLNEAQ